MLRISEAVFLAQQVIHLSYRIKLVIAFPYLLPKVIGLTEMEKVGDKSRVTNKVRHDLPTS